MSKEISFYGLKPTRTLEREIEKRVDKWIRREQGGHTHHKWDYAVEIERVGTPHVYYCSIRMIRSPLFGAPLLGSDEWRSHGTGKTLHDALTDAFKNIRAVVVVSLTQQPAFA